MTVSIYYRYWLFLLAFAKVQNKRQAPGHGVAEGKETKNCVSEMGCDLGSVGHVYEYVCVWFIFYAITQHHSSELQPMFFRSMPL